jgi:hypothetical protein
MKALLATLTLIAVLAVVAGTSFWCGIQFSLHHAQAVASNHAVWIARTWTEGMSIRDMCSAADRAGNVRILRDEWNSGTGEDIASGPVVSGRRICIRRDRAIYWRTAQ